MLRYASVCDGIGAVHVAARGLGWECAWTSEIEPFPIAVVDHHYGYPNLGDMLAVTEADLERHGRIDLLVPKLDDVRSLVVYLDPPYTRRTRGSGGGAVYRFDVPRDPAEEAAWHARLAAAARRFKRARVVVSYYEDEAVHALYEGWTRRTLARNKSLANQNRRGTVQSEPPEVLYINGPSHEAGGLW
jgi:hypothetical protein